MNQNHFLKDDTHQIEYLKQLKKEGQELGIQETKSDSEESVKFLRRRNEQKERAKDIFGIFGYAAYQNYDPLKFSFEYPKNWIKNKIKTYGGEGLTISIMGPLNEYKTQNAEMKIIITPSERCAEPNILEKYMKYRVIRNIYRDLKIISQIRTHFSNTNFEAIDSIISYSLPVDSSKSLYIKIIKRALIAKNNHRFYELSYLADHIEFDKYLEAYEHAKETFKIVEMK